MFEREPVVDPTGYPAARKRRGGPIVEVDPEIAAFLEENASPPRTRVIPFAMTATVSARRTISTPLLVGPAILKRITWSVDTASDPPSNSIEIGFSLTILTEAGVALTTVRPYAVLTELQDPFAFGNLAGSVGYPIWTLPNTHTQWERVVDLIVLEPRFCFTVSYINNVAVGNRIVGNLNVLEGVSPAALRAFTGS